MKAVLTYTPQSGQVQPVTLLLQQGYTEIINDSNYLLTINLAGGQVFQVPGVAQMYRTPNGGGAFTIQAGTQVQYMFGDLGISDNVTVNQYEPEEFISQSYPYTLVRSTSTLINTQNQLNSSATATNLVSGLTASLSWNLNPVSNVAGFVYLSTLDMSLDQESTTHSWTLTLSPIGGSNGNQTFIWVGHTKTTTDTQLLLRWNPPLVATVQGNGSILTATIGAVAGSTARAQINMSGFFQ